MTPELGARTRADTPHTCITTVSVRSAHELDRNRSPVPARNGHVLVARRHLVRCRCAVALGPRYGGASPGRSLVEFVAPSLPASSRCHDLADARAGAPTECEASGVQGR